MAAFTPHGSYCSVIIVDREDPNMLGGFKVSRFDIEIRNAQFGA